MNDPLLDSQLSLQLFADQRQAFGEAASDRSCRPGDSAYPCAGHWHSARSALGRIYQKLTVKDVDLGYAGRFHSRHRAHKDIAALAPGDLLDAKMNGQKRWELFDGNGNRVGRLAKGYNPPEGVRFLSAKVIAIVTRTRELSEPQYKDSIKCDAWEVIVPEIVFGPE